MIPTTSANIRTKIVLRIISTTMIIIGIVLAIIGFNQQNISMDAPNWFEESSAGMFKMFVGGALIFLGIALIYISFIGRVAKYLAVETKPAIRVAGGGAGAGIAEGIREGGGIKLDVGGVATPREIVKIKCRHCGYLDSEDAVFCSKCGARL